MKKILTIFLILGCSGLLSAGGGFSVQVNYEPQAVFNFGGSNEVHPLYALNGYDYGVKVSGDTWLLKGGQATLTTTIPTAILSVTLYYRIYKSGAPSAWSSVSLVERSEGYNPYGTTWNYTDLSVNVLEHSIVNEAGTYYLEFYYEAETSDSGTKYYFTSSSPAQASFTTTSALPVELTTFAGNVNDNEVSLNWETATEVNNYGFEIERQKSELGSINLSWEKIGFVEGHGNSNSPKLYSFSDNSITAGTYYYRLKQIDVDGQFEYSDVIEVSITQPESLELFQNYPNPFNPKTNIKFSLKESSNVVLTIYNTIGQEVAVLINQNLEAGIHTSVFDGSNLNSGIYIYSLKTENSTITKKMIMLK